jgi:hypothetical protein
MNINSKVCKKCGQAKSIEEFYTTGKPRKDGTPQRQGTCKVCMTEILKQWRKDHPTEYRNQHTRNGNKRTQRLQRDELYREKQREYKKMNSKKNFISGLLSRAKQRSVKYGLPFDLTPADIQVPEKCPLLEVPFVLGTKDNYAYSPSLDRIDPVKGYVRGNVRVISTLANTMKNNATKEQLLIFSSNLAAYLKDDIV